jgi:hypothetical protein
MQIPCEDVDIGIFTILNTLFQYLQFSLELCDRNKLEHPLRIHVFLLLDLQERFFVMAGDDLALCRPYKLL